MGKDKRASTRVLPREAAPANKDTLTIARGIQGVVLGTADTRPLCELIPPGTMSIRVCCDYMPTRQFHCFCLVIPGEQAWSCGHERCGQWVEEQAKRLTTYDDTLPDKLYEYLDAMYETLAPKLLAHMAEEAKEERTVDPVAWLREHGDVLLLNYVKWLPETQHVLVQSQFPPLIEMAYIAEKIDTLERPN